MDDIHRNYTMIRKVRERGERPDGRKKESGINRNIAASNTSLTPEMELPLSTVTGGIQCLLNYCTSIRFIRRFANGMPCRRDEMLWYAHFFLHRPHSFGSFIQWHFVPTFIHSHLSWCSGKMPNKTDSSNLADIGWTECSLWYVWNLTFPLVLYADVLSFSFPSDIPFSYHLVFLLVP